MYCCIMCMHCWQSAADSEYAAHAQNKAGEAKEESKGYLQTAQEKAGSLFGQTQNEASKAKGEAKDNLNSAADKASDKADQAHKEGKGTQQSAPHWRASVHVHGS